MSELSPMMRHYIELKEKYKDCILLYRLGDFTRCFSTMRSWHLGNLRSY